MTRHDENNYIQCYVLTTDGQPREDPAHITSLTHQQLQEAHAKHLCPSYASFLGFPPTATCLLESHIEFSDSSQARDLEKQRTVSFNLFMSKWADINVSSHKIYYQLTFSVNFVTQSFPAVKSTHTRGYTQGSEACGRPCYILHNTDGQR
ncbi:hypothetical protein RRG08_047645 [Elysia crispata]|uniref:Uncharacterized protein n=1 Tax=Elysia crispata TaxID=231223 RepID=A0AAE1AU62_9GAST|nr:hypothetical protein RRG08_047645 [Elysia crispata]